MRDRHYLRWFPRAMHREVEQAVGRTHYGNRVKLTGVNSLRKMRY
jgi:hypothetical protein